MKRPDRLFACALVLAVSLTGCGGTPSGDSAKGSTGAAGGRSGSKYDAGARAGASAADDELAEKGEGLFSTKGCTACHAQGRRLTGPDLAGVSMRRTQAWLEHQILDPATMAQEDPISRELMAKHALQMPNQKLTADEAKAVIEFLKHHDQEAGLAPVAAK